MPSITTAAAALKPGICRSCAGMPDRTAKPLISGENGFGRPPIQTLLSQGKAAGFFRRLVVDGAGWSGQRRITGVMVGMRTMGVGAVTMRTAPTVVWITGVTAGVGLRTAGTLVRTA